MPNTENRKNSNKKPTLQEHSQTVIIPQLTPEMLEQARRAAEQGKTAEQIEQEALAAAQAEQKAVESKQEAPTAEKPKTVQPANKPKTRKEAEEELAQNIHDDHLWLNNPVMVRGLGLAPIVAAAVSGQNAWMLCAATILLITATRMLAVAICHLTGNRFRGVVYSYAAAIVYIPAYIILYNLFGADLSLLGIYLPMLVVEPAVIKRMESNDLETVGEAFRRGINNTIGICFSVLLVGVVRELLAEGTVFGNVVFPVAPLPLADQPGTGFIIIGLIAALGTVPMCIIRSRRCVICMVINASAELSVLQAVAQFLTYAVMAVFAENAVFFRALGVSRLNKLVNDPKISTWQYCIPIILVQTISAPMGWAAQSLTLPALAKVLPGWLPVNALRPLVFLNCSLIAMGIVWLLLGLFPKSRDACREQLPGATFNCCVLGTLLVAASQNYNLLQSIGFGFGSGVGYLVAVLVVDEGRRRLRSKDIPHIFRGLPSVLIYIGILSLAIYGLVGTVD